MRAWPDTPAAAGILQSRQQTQLHSAAIGRLLIYRICCVMDIIVVICLFVLSLLRLCDFPPVQLFVSFSGSMIKVLAILRGVNDWTDSFAEKLGAKQIDHLAQARRRLIRELWLIPATFFAMSCLWAGIIIEGARHLQSSLLLPFMAVMILGLSTSCHGFATVARSSCQGYLDVFPHINEIHPVEFRRLPAGFGNRWSLSSCPICLDGFSSKEIILPLSCGHIFHVTCINSWLHRELRCPLCNSHALIKIFPVQQGDTSDTSVSENTSEASVPQAQPAPHQHADAFRGSLS